MTTTSPLPFQYRPTENACWTAHCTGCLATSIAYPLKSNAHEWARDHRCPARPVSGQGSAAR